MFLNPKPKIRVQGLGLRGIGRRMQKLGFTAWRSRVEFLGVPRFRL